MNILFGPAISVMSRLGLRQKLFLLAVVALVPLFILSFQYYQVLILPLSSTAEVNTSIKNQAFDLFIFVLASSVTFIYLLLGQFFVSRDILPRIKDANQKINVALNHQEYVPLLNYFRKEKILYQRKIDKIMASITEVSSAAEMLVAMTESSVKGSHEQGLAVNSIASAIEQMSASLQQVEEQAASTQDSSAQSNTLAIDGEKVSQQAIKDVQSIAASVDESSSLINSLDGRSQQIGSIIKVIESISEQTNLLALNAAIEAARAGEHGRGFSVVADEVRALATRSHQAASEVSEQIQKIQHEIQIIVDAMDKVSKSVENGVDLIVLSGESLQKIKKGTNETSEMFISINSAINEQGDVSRTIAKNIDQINQQGQRQNRITDEIEAASEYLVTLASQAKDISQ